MYLPVTNADDHTLVALPLAHDLREVCLTIANHSKVRLVDALFSFGLFEVATLLEKLAERMLDLFFLLHACCWHTIRLLHFFLRFGQLF